MSVFKDLQKYVKSHHVIAAIGVILLVSAIMQYSERKQSNHESMAKKEEDNNTKAHVPSHVEGSSTAILDGEDMQFASVPASESNSKQIPASCNIKSPPTTASDLLPKNNTDGSLGVSHQAAGALAGKLSPPLRNANLTFRADPVIPDNAPRCWMNNPTIEPEDQSKKMEIGCN